MSEPDRSDALLVAKITVSRYLTADGQEQLDVDATTVDGSQLDLVSALGMLSVAQLTYAAQCQEDDDG
ncbi:hypothetical protein [Nocardia farcinica]|uniref:hypothetical protein n=1 Tax=Nocardia farcinica TaxID=37329 RepID=UPI00344A8360